MMSDELNDNPLVHYLVISNYLGDFAGIVYSADGITKSEIRKFRNIHANTNKCSISFSKIHSDFLRKHGFNKYLECEKL